MLAGWGTAQSPANLAQRGYVQQIGKGSRDLAHSPLFIHFSNKYLSHLLNSRHCWRTEYTDINETGQPHSPVERMSINNYCPEIRAASRFRQGSVWTERRGWDIDLGHTSWGWGLPGRRQGKAHQERGVHQGTRKLTCWRHGWQGEEGEKRGRLGPGSEGWEHPTTGFKRLWEMLAGNDILTWGRRDRTGLARRGYRCWISMDRKGRTSRWGWGRGWGWGREWSWAEKGLPSVWNEAKF